MTTRSKKIMAMVFGWILGVAGGAGFLAIFQSPADKGYWSSVAVLAAFLLVMLVAYWVRDDMPRMRRGLLAIALVLLIPTLILGFSFGLAPALGAFLGGLIVALIILWPYLTGKGTALRTGTEEQ